jgi:hypothetical protein
MSSSTSNSRDEWQVLFAVVLALAACEVATRAKVARHAFDLHKQQIPGTAAELSDQPSPRILFLGNSLTKLGVNVDSFRAAFTDHALQAPACAKVHPDDTTIQHWYYVFERHFSSRNTAPECVIFTFCYDHLSDQVEPRDRRLAKTIQGPAQLTDVLLKDMTSIDRRVGFLMAYLLRAVSDQSELKNAVLNRLIPHYSKETQRLNSVRRKYEEAKVSQEDAPQPAAFTYRRLERLIELLRQSGSHGVFCLMPLPSEQSLDPELVRTIESGGMTFLDLRELICQTEGHYPDGYHMDSVAADIYSRAIADALTTQSPKLFVADGSECD